MMSRQNNEKLYILIKIFLLCFCWTFISFGVESFCVWFEVETNELHLIIEFILQYFLTYGGIKRYTSSSSSKKCMDNEAIFIITMRSPEIWEYDYESPLEISIHKDAYKSSRTTLKKAGESFYAGAQYYVTSLKKSNVTTETSVGAEAGVTISGSTATTVEWSRNETKLHKIYAIVKLNKFTANGAYLKQSGEVQFAE